MGETPNFKLEQGNYQKFEFSVSGATARLIRNEVGSPHNIPGVNSQNVYKYILDIHSRLPHVIDPGKEMGLSLTETDINMITVLLSTRRFGNSNEAEISATRYKQAIWEINTAFVRAGGPETDNFRSFINNYFRQNKD